jgi:putative ABC transport system permease protein
MGLSEPLGKVVKLWGKNRQIIGIVKDFHFESLHQKVKPLFIRLEPDNTYYVMIKLKAGSEKETIAQLERVYKTFNPGFSFDYRFLDADYQSQYIAEQRVGILSRYFAGLAILISIDLMSRVIRTGSIHSRKKIERNRDQKSTWFK